MVLLVRLSYRMASPAGYVILRESKNLNLEGSRVPAPSTSGLFNYRTRRIQRSNGCPGRVN